MTPILLNSKYKPLRNLSTRYAIVTGGRGSGKSFAIATLLLSKAAELRGKTILFTRYTLTNAETSIMPEFLDKIERGGLQRHFSKSGNDIVCTDTGTRILFRGIKTSSGINTAALKSIPNLVLWVNDESEELVDENVFNTIDLSIRDRDTFCQVWLVLNPSDVTHFIYRRFFQKNGIEGGYNGHKEDVTYIHTTYLDNKANLPEDYISKAERLKIENEKLYRHLWLGEWECNRDGLVYPDWQELPNGYQFPTGLPQVYGLDWGYNPDPTAVVRIAYNPATSELWVREVACENKSLPEDIAPLIAADAASAGIAHHTELVICDAATPAGIASLQRQGFNAQPADKKDREYQVSWLRQMRVYYTGEHIKREVQRYSFLPSSYDKTVFTRTPADGDDHFMDAIRYGAYTYIQHYAQQGHYSFGYANNYIDRY